MARIAKLSGNTLATVKVAPSFSYVITDDVSEPGDVKVIPFVSGKYLNSAAVIIPSAIVEYLSTNTLDIPEDDENAETE